VFELLRSLSLSAVFSLLFVDSEISPSTSPFSVFIKTDNSFQLASSSESDHSPSSSQTPHVAVVPLKKKRKSSRKPSFHPAFIPSLRVMKRDIRRSYCDIVMNVLNSQDISFLSSYFHTFCLPSVETFDNDLQVVPDNYLRPTHTVGYERMLESCRISFLIFPDLVYFFTNAEIRVRLHEKGSHLVGDLQLVGTQLFDLPSSTSAVNALIPVEIKIEFVLKGKFHFVLDENHRIQTIRLMFESYQPKVIE
jgi:hypothetical protein